MRLATSQQGVITRAPSIVRIVIPETRTIVRPLGTRVTRRRSVELAKRRGLPVTSVRQTVLDLSAQPGFTLDEAAALLGRAAQRQLLKPEQLLEALHAAWHHPQTGPLQRVCADAIAGVESTLESRILITVIRAHGLDGFALQVPLDATGPDSTRGSRVTRPDSTRPVERNDLRNVHLGIRIEADGVAWHRDTFHEDRRRDRRAAAAADLTVRLTWDAAERPCEAALDLALAMTHRGWTGAPTACGRSCEIPRRWAAQQGPAAS